MTDKKKDQSLGGFAKKTNFKWLGVGVIIFTLLALMPTPESMVSKAESDKETRETEKKSWSQEKVIEYSEIRSIKEAMLDAVNEKFRDDPEREEDLKEMINDWSDLKIKLFTDRRSWVRNPDKETE